MSPLPTAACSGSPGVLSLVKNEGGWAYPPVTVYRPLSQPKNSSASQRSVMTAPFDSRQARIVSRSVWKTTGNKLPSQSLFLFPQRSLGCFPKHVCTIDAAGDAGVVAVGGDRSVSGCVRVGH